MNYLDTIFGVRFLIADLLQLTKHEAPGESLGGELRLEVPAVVLGPPGEVQHQVQVGLTQAAVSVEVEEGTLGYIVGSSHTAQHSHNRPQN